MNKIILPRCLKRIKPIILTLPILIQLGCSTSSMDTVTEYKKAEDSLLILQKENLELGILADVGGRVVLLREAGGENLLKSDPTLWNEAAVDRFSPGDEPVWKEYGGHIVWLAPQSDWWNHQTEFPQMKDKDWPPDPYIIYGKYDVVESSPAYAKLIGPNSPVSGMRLIKEYWVEADQTVRLRVTAENIRDEPVNWGIWTTTRFPGETRSYLPLDPRQDPEFSFKGSFADSKNPLPYRIVNGFFTFSIDEPVPAGMEGWSNKVFATSLDGWLAAFPGKKAFIKRADTRFANQVHEEHGFAEIYNNVPANQGGWSLLELELHGPYSKIFPRDSISVEEVWHVFDYDGACDALDQSVFLWQISKQLK
ncbi:DUF4380 domain-containing protein [Rubellicoccus peritrichatus]|uniref:DUF4380 domain-containing protein n=1 Tax=Rubellicoccus peritrichatus TaxID=3080537 RepID=A0AAQ3LFY1_9BACT|nr:DUF4380 domain-containing protein [Puniceicoccus sp. CR14]WOO41374.1 DUF4380 domain-containing protein [Puniceicoccus sp. CR14]